jgi:uncharacterized repeat protein (TIGR01451 family)
LLDSLGDRLMYRLAYRNFGDHESLVVSHSVVADPVNQNSGIRWYELRDPGGTPTIAQQSTFAPDSNFRWMGSVAMDQVGDMAVGYSVSSSNMFPSIAVAARLATDPPNTLQTPEISIMTGTGSQTNGLTRWGDYSAMQLDPVDDCTFWYTTEYLKNTGSFNWNTRITTLKFPGCDKPDLNIAVSHSGTYTQNQNGATFAIDVNNVGAKPTDGTLVTVTATLPTGLTATAASGTGWSCTPGTTTTCTRTDVLNAGAAYPTITVTVNVDKSAPGLVTNTATVSGGGEVNPANDTSSDVVTVIQLGPDPAVAKAHSGPFIQGQTGTYTITVTNVGLSPLSGDPTDPVTVKDTLPAGLTANAAGGMGWACVLGPPVSCTRSDTLASNAAYPAITLTVNIASNAPLGTAVNTATVSGGGDVNTLNDTANDPTKIIPPPPDLSITKTHSGNFNQGQSGVSYTLTVSNASGAGSTAGTVTVSDTLPTGLTVSSVSTAGGWSCIFNSTTATCSRNDVLAPGNSYPIISIFVTVAQNAPASVTNTATVTGGGDITPGNNTASDTTTINQTPDLTITKSHTPDPFVVGSTGTYTITVSNEGSIATSGQVNVLDVMPPGLIANAVSATGWNCNALPSSVVSCNRSDTLAVNSSYPVITVTVGVTAGDGGPVTNTATVSGGGEFNTANDNAHDVTNVNAPVLAITKSHVGNFTLGQNGTYTITVGNQGQLPTLGTSVNVTDNMPTGLTATAISATGWSCSTVPTTFVSCSRSDVLANGASYPPISVTVQIDPTSAIANVTNIAGVTGGGDLSVHSAFDQTLINLPDLTIAKTHSGNFVSGETGAVYTLTVSNASTSVSTAGGTVKINDFLPFNLTATAASGTGWTCTILTSQQVDCTEPAGNLAPGASYPPITVTVNVATTAVPITVTNLASVSGIADANFGNNVAFDVTRIVMPVSLTATSPTTVTVSAGTAATFSFTANLSTNPPVGNVTFMTNLLPPNSKGSFSSTTITQSGTVTLTIDTSGSGHVATLTGPRFDRWTTVYAAMFFAVLALFSTKRSKERGSKRWLWAGVGAFGLMLAMVFVGCGGHSTPTPPPVITPPGTYTITMTANSSNNGIPAASVPLVVVVK